MQKQRKSVNNKLVHDEYKEYSGWEEVIRAARFQLLRAQVRQRELEGVIRVFTEKKNAGEPWPGLAGSR